MAVAYWRNVFSKIPTRMTVDVSNVISNSDNSAIIAVLGSVDNKVYFVVQFSAANGSRAVTHDP